MVKSVECVAQKLQSSILSRIFPWKHHLDAQSLRVEYILQCLPKEWNWKWYINLWLITLSILVHWEGPNLLE